MRHESIMANVKYLHEPIYLVTTKWQVIYTEVTKVWNSRIGPSNIIKILKELSILYVAWANITDFL